MNLAPVLAVAATLAAASAPAQSPGALFPFVLPWDDASPGVTDCAHLLDAPAGKHGHIRLGDDGHFYAGPRRIRFFGVNVTNSAGLPAREEAEKIAGRMAKFGINVVRFHFMDATWGDTIWRKGAPGELDPGALDRLGYFIAQLKAHGIYSNINLLVGRHFKSAEGLPAEIDKLDWKESHIPGFFDAKHLALQKDYARRLLTHRNPHTGLTFAEEPAVAFVEINNENGLIHSWLGGDVDKLPEIFRTELRAQWNAWLLVRHGSTAKLKTAWGVKEEPLGAEMLRNADFAARLDGWTLEQHGGAAARAETFNVSGSGNGVRISVDKAGAESWHVQFNQRALRLAAGQPCTLRFRARANRAQTVRVSVEQAHEPWSNLGLATAAEVTPAWREQSFVFNAPASDKNARLCFSSLGNTGTVVELADITLRPGGVFGLAAQEQTENGAVPVFAHNRIGERTPTAQRDWMQFLWETEDAYWQAMRGFLKVDLAVKGLVTGTIIGCAPPNMMAKMEWADTHAYWQHPRFPGRSWDLGNWFVDNRTMVNERGGTLPGLAARRVLGRPHAVTEYNHPAPNTYSGEGFLLLAAYGALQDWDAIYAYTYAHGRPQQGWDARQICGFFDVDQHPVKMVTFPAAAAIFLRGDVHAAVRLVVAPLGREQEIDILRRASAWKLVDATHAGVPETAALVHRIALATEGRNAPAEALRPVDLRLATDRFVSDTGELAWDVSNAKRGVVTIDTPRSKGVIGFGGGKRFALGEISIEPGAGAQNGWSAITLTARDGAPRSWLLTAAGSAANTGMQWKNAEHSTVGRDWGGAPSLVEGVPARIVFPRTAGVAVWALDERGQRREPVPIVAADSGAAFEIGPRWRTLWYEVEEN